MKFGFGRKPRLAVARAAVDFLLLASLSFAAGSLATPWAIPAVRDFFYQMPVLAWVHTFTLGWISSALIGAILVYLPAFGRRPVRFPRLPELQFVLYLIGASGVISHFFLGSWDGVWMAGVVVIVSILLFAPNLIPALASRAKPSPSEWGLVVALGFLALAAIVGVMLALDKSLNFLGGDVLRNLSAHAHLAALGWIGLAVCAMSYRLAPALLDLSRKPLTGTSVEIAALSAAVVGLVLALAGPLPDLPLWALAAALALAVYLVAMVRLVRSPGLPMTWPLCHLAASLVSLALALILGLMLSVTGAQNELGNRLAGAYGILALLGWIGNLIIAVFYHLLPAAVARARGLHRWPRGFGQGSRFRMAVFCGFNLALGAIVLGLLVQLGWLAEAGALLLAATGLGYNGAALWSLSFAYRK